MPALNSLRLMSLATMGGLLLAMMPAAVAQVRTIDPNAAIGAAPAGQSATAAAGAASSPAEEAFDADLVKPEGQGDAATPASQTTATPAASTAAASAATTFRKDDLIGAAEGVFGKGAQGLGELMEKILKDQGEPNGYIAGREAAGAFVVGLRYGSGTLTHSVEGQRPVYWTGPSLGFDIGGDATKVFVLVYNLYDSQDLYKRFAQVEGRAYFVGGLSATYLRRGDVALIPVRLGVGVRLGANIGYMKFSEKSRWLPF